MIVLILALIVSLIPAIALYLWLKNCVRDDTSYKALCGTALIKGVLCIFPVVLCSAVLQIIVNLTGVKTANPLLYQVLYTFIVIAFAEELVKYLTFRRTLKKTDYRVSWLDVAILMTITGIGFDLTESIVYAIGESVSVILIRGICVPHAGYGFLSGYFYGKGEKNRNTTVKWTGLVLTWLMHGLYDFSLSKDFIAINDNLVFIPLILAIIEVVLVILLIRFVIKRKKQEEYMEPLPAEEKADM